MSLAFGRGYCDLNIPYNAENVESMVQKAVDLGYQTVAINVKVHQKNLMTKSKQQYLSRKSELKENLMLDFPAPPEVNAREGITILFRLTIKFTNNDFLPFFVNSETVKKYDLLALHPESTLAIQNLLKNGFKAEIICFDPNNVKVCFDLLDFSTSSRKCTNSIPVFLYLLYSQRFRDAAKRL